MRFVHDQEGVMRIRNACKLSKRCAIAVHGIEALDGQSMLCQCRLTGAIF